MTPQTLVYLVGAGPGDPGLLTLAGRDALASAAVVIYDALANPALLAHAPPQTEFIYAGKQSNRHTLSQAQINALLVEKWHQVSASASAHDGQAPRHIVRLKGGDPYVFGRGGEEAQYLFAHNVPFRVIPGITSGIAGPAYAGIPVTHREVTSTLTLVTGHQQEGGVETTGVNFDALAKLDGTLVFYMGVKSMPTIAAKLVAAGLDPGTPAAVIQRATHPSQKTLRTTVGELQAAERTASIAPPAITIIGRVAAMGPELNWFEKRPLFGQTVLVTRTRDQAGELTHALMDLGARVIEAPTIELAPPTDAAALQAAIRRISSMDMAIFTSVNGVGATWNELRRANLDARCFPKKVIAVGPSTRQALSQIGIIADLMPDEFTGDKLAVSVQQRLGDIRNARIILLRAQIARPALSQALSQAGAIVEDVAIYQTLRPAQLPPAAIAALDAGEITLATFTSASTANNLYAMLPTELRSKIRSISKLSIGPITSDALRTLGWGEHLIEAAQHDIPGMIKALSEAALPDCA